MWLMFSNCFLSIVRKDCGEAELLVRARRRGDIERMFPSAKVTEDTKTDYLYRAGDPQGGGHGEDRHHDRRYRLPKLQGLGER
jgi:hypothetical protein